MLTYSVFLISISLLVSFVGAQTGLSASEKQEIVNAHNYFRGRVNPVATNMEKMVWNAELAAVSQEYAEQCVFDHNPGRTNQQNSFNYVGENLAITTARANYTDLVRGWNDEVADYDFVSNQCSPSRVCGHYTQVVWASSNNVGCGVFRCSSPIPGFNYANGLNFVCNYGPGGNINSRRPYTTGVQSCSACPSEDQIFCVSNLCSASASPAAGGGTGYATIARPFSMTLTLSIALIIMYMTMVQ